MSDNLLTIEAVMAAIGLKRTKIYAMIGSGQFPQPIKIGTASRWSEAEVNAWIAERKQERQAA
jgi:prophage regulatory protein